MLDRIASLPVPAVQLIHQSLRVKFRQSILNEEPTDGGRFYQQCLMAGLSHAEVVTSITNKTGEIVTVALEHLIGHPITRKTPPAQVGMTKRTRTAKIDPRVITFMLDHNPKLPGTRAHTLWDLYEVGMTADEFVAKGGTRSALRYDANRGFIKLEVK